MTEFELGGKEIEFHLDGYGSFSDSSSEPASRNLPQPVAKSQNEIDVENQLKTEQNAARIKYLRGEIDRMRNLREREDRHNRREHEEYMPERERIIWERRLTRGSRFIIKYKSALPPSTVTNDLKLYFYDSLEDLKNVVNSKGEETWSK
jgi:hypothetical protein